MLMVVAGRVASVAHEQLVGCPLLGVVARHIALALLAHHVADDAFLRLEVIAYGVGFVRCVAFGEHRLAREHAQRVLHAVSVDGAAVHVHGYDGRRQLYPFVRVIHLAFAIQVGVSPLGEHNGVGCLVGDGRIQPLLLLGRCSQRVGRQRVGTPHAHRVGLQRVGHYLQGLNLHGAYLPHTALRRNLSREEQECAQ